MTMRMNKQMSSKLFLAYLVISLVFGATLILTFYLFNIQNIRANAQANLAQLNRNMLNQVDSQIKILDSVSIEIVSNVQFISDLESIDDPDPSIAEAAKVGIKQSILNTYVNKYDIYRISVITGSGQFISTGATSLQPKEIANYVKSNSWLENPLALSGRKFILPPHVDSWLAEADQQVISVVRAVYINGRIIGFVEIQQIQQIMSRIFDQNFNDYKVRGVLIDSDGSVIYDSNPAPANFDSPQTLEQLRSLMKQYVSQTVQHENQFLNIGSSNYLDWQLALVVPVRVVYREMYQVFLTIALFSILIIVLSMIFFQIVIRRITHPIMALVRQMSDVDIDTLDQEFAIDSRSFEAGVLSKSFQQMTQRLRESINDQNRLRDIQVKTNFDALQSQIGPHFLFNSLGSIAYMCENGQSSSAADACYSLTDILRYSANYQQPIVTLKDESELLRSYLYLMKMRYQHRINYSIQIDDQLLTLNLPRLTLQPLVENAIKYGLAEIETVQIKVMAHLSESVVRLTVSDNGAGFSALSIDQINARYLEMMRDTKDVDRCKISFGRMGLLGTLVRLSLFFGQSFDYQIEINADRGASVHLFLPFTGQPMSPDSEKGA